MALVTGTPIGVSQTQEDIYLESAPYIYVQDYNQPPRYNPDADGFYWGMTGSATYPYYEIGCPVDVSLGENVTINEVLCDNVGTKSTVQQRNYLTFNFTVQSFFPLQTLRILLKGGVVTETPPTQKFGLGAINNNQYWMIYAPKVYDEDAADYIWLHLNKCQFVDAWNITMPFGSSWQVSIQMRAYADTTKPAAQKFGMWGRLDPSVIT